jgi:hypothetical protein
VLPRWLSKVETEWAGSRKYVVPFISYDPGGGRVSVLLAAAEVRCGTSG